MERISIDSWCSGGDSTKMLLECKFGVLPLCQPVWYIEIWLWDLSEMKKECHLLDADIQCYNVILNNNTVMKKRRMY